jgi:hypothetical protein
LVVSRSRARARPASPGSGRTSWRSWTGSRRTGSSACSSARSDSCRITSRSSGTSTSRRVSAQLSLASSSIASSP